MSVFNWCDDIVSLFVMMWLKQTMRHNITWSTIYVPHSFCISRNRYKFTCASYLSKQEVIVFTYVETYLVTWTKTTIDYFSYQGLNIILHSENNIIISLLLLMIKVWNKGSPHKRSLHSCNQGYISCLHPSI